MTPEQDALDLARRVKSQWAGTPFKDGWPPVAEHAFILASALLSLAAQRDELRGENEELRYDDGVRRNLTELLLSEQRRSRFGACWGRPRTQRQSDKRRAEPLHQQAV
jgi:hypothetical protein